MANKDTVSISKEMRNLIGLAKENAIRGNLAAQVVNFHERTDDDPLAGINLGWTDRTASTDFLVGIVHMVDEFRDNGDAVDVHYVADNAVQWPTRDLLEIVLDLHLSGETPETSVKEMTVSDVAESVLFEYAYNLATHLAYGLGLGIE